MDRSKKPDSQQDRPIALAAYEELAERYAAIAPQKAENGYIEHPAMRTAIGAVQSLRVLEAGCGPGLLAAYLVQQGATIVAFDVSPRMIELARARVAGATFFVADMAKPLTELPNAAFDLVVSSLAIDYVRDWTTPLSEFRRVLRPGGRLVFSVQHPLGAYLWYTPETAFGVHYVEATWRGFGGEPVVVPDYWRSFAEIVNPLIQAGFKINKVTDTRPIPELEAKNPERYAKYMKVPTFMIIEACTTS